MPWKQWCNRRPTSEDVAIWIKNPIQNYAIVCGKISNLIVIDVDTKNGGDPTPFLDQDLYTVKTPSGGYHFYIPYDPLIQKHRQRKFDTGILKAVDIQSDNMLAFAPPSVFLQGGYTIQHNTDIKPLPDDLFAKVVQALTVEEDLLSYVQPFKAKTDPLTKKPGDIFNALASWDDVLLPLGWEKVGRPYSDVQYWRRPGKRDGISASTNYKGYDLFFCFSTSVGDIDFNKSSTASKGYTKFSLYTLLKFNGDFRAAAKSLIYENYKIANNLKI
jgi:hypothetical protein